MKILKNFILVSILTLSTPLMAQSAVKKITGSLKSTLTGHKLVAISESNQAESVELTGKKFSITPPSSISRLYVIGPDNQVAYQVVASVCTKSKSGSDKGQYTKCSSKTLVRTGIKAGANLGTLKVFSGGALLSKKNKADYTKIASTTLTADAVNYVPVGIASSGLGTSSISSFTKKQTDRLKRKIRAKADTADSDEDGLVNSIDSDDDGDSILDNYDSSSTGSTTASSFKVFSNFKLNIEQSLNFHATTLNSSRIDEAMRSVQTLAIQVAGSTADTVELDCGSLGYCSSGGTGSTVEGNNSFPGIAGGTLDSDSDGLGSISRGSTGDFQLKTGATTSQIAASDTFIERVTSSTGVETEIPGMLNFVFHSTPALKTVAVNSEPAQTIDYSAESILGSSNNCISAPSSGDVSITITGWRPQRPGISSAGEGDYVDLGNSIIVADIPNGPCSGTGCSSTGPGTCAASSYSTSDANLTAAGDGLQDNKGDIGADTTNTYTFTVNLTTCLSAAPSGPITWAPGESLFVDLQFKSRDGDNAAQKFCVKRSPTI